MATTADMAGRYQSIRKLSPITTLVSATVGLINRRILSTLVQHVVCYEVSGHGGTVIRRNFGSAWLGCSPALLVRRVRSCFHGGQN